MGRFDEWLDDTRPVTVAPVTGIGDTIGMLMSHGNISPYIMAWLITVLIRLATGQGVVSAMTAAGIISAAILDPATGQLVGVDPVLLVLATAAGSNTLTHINDASFWLFKGYFDRHCCKVSDEAAFCLIQRPYISKTLLTRRISPRGSP
ncbi:high-affinity gluconate transporter [Escherichia coli]|nr:high-affinity gluconate transporter [Escherichia coli]STG11862.1 high-affinity gluconate transporter [Escherichia coli]STI26677.1 high-affinity gluconate transporter [Escherichia coli]